MKKKLLSTLVATGVVFSVAMVGTASAELVFSDDFTSGVDSAWSSTETYTTPLFTSHGGTTGLGKFGNDTVTLSLDNLKDHDQVTVSFELYLNGSWDGNGDSMLITPDYWIFSQDGTEELKTTFSNIESLYSQAYPNGGSNPAHTGSAEFNNKGWHFGNSVYELSFTFAHSASTLQLGFAGENLASSLRSESWGLDNVTVTSSSSSSVPEPSALLLFGAGVAGLVAIGRRRKNK